MSEKVIFDSIIRQKGTVGHHDWNKMNGDKGRVRILMNNLFV